MRDAFPFRRHRSLAEVEETAALEAQPLARLDRCAQARRVMLRLRRVRAAGGDLALARCWALQEAFFGAGDD